MQTKQNSSDIQSSTYDQTAPQTIAWTMGAILPWASMAAVIEYALNDISSIQLLFWCFVFAMPASFIWEKIFGGRRATDLFKVSWRVILIGTLGIFGWTAGVLLSLERAPVIEANLLTYLWPLMMVTMSPLAGERFSFVSLLGAVIGFAGAGLIVTGGNGFYLKPEFVPGYSLALAGAIAWALFVILLQRQGISGMRRSPIFVLAGFACSTILVLIFDNNISIPPPHILLAAAWLGIGPMSLSFASWDRAVTSKYLGLVGRLSYFDPLISTLALMFFLSLMPTNIIWLGIIMIITGVALPEICSSRSQCK